MTEAPRGPHSPGALARLFTAAMVVLPAACPFPEAFERVIEARMATDADGNPSPTATAEVLNDHGNTLDDRGRHEEALRFYDAALERYRPEQAKNRAGCLFNKGLALRRMKRWEESVSTYERSYEVDPEQRLAINISIPLAEAGRVDEAVEWLDRELTQFPDDIALIETKASTLREAGRHGEAVRLARRALAIREASGGRADQSWIKRWREYLAECAAHDAAERSNGPDVEDDVGKRGPPVKVSSLADWPEGPFEPTMEQQTQNPLYRFSDQVEEAAGIPPLDKATAGVEVRFQYTNKRYVRIFRDCGEVTAAIYERSDAKEGCPPGVEPLVMRDPVIGGSVLCLDQSKRVKWRRLLKQLDEAGLWKLKSRWSRGCGPGPQLVIKMRRNGESRVVSLASYGGDGGAPARAVARVLSDAGLCSAPPS